jgi:hypothetical protein
MLLIAMLLGERPTGARLRVKAMLYFAVSVALNFAPGRRLGKLALFYSAHFLSSIAAFLAVATGLWRIAPESGSAAAGRSSTPIIRTVVR